MADAKKFQFDVWLTHANTVYRGVPYEVVTDWIQQGRLLEDDRIRPVGAEDWFVLANVPAFAGYIPRPEELRTDQQAEALEPVESPFAWGKGEEEEDADPDMIPLIDVSLVLLIFFMMTSTVSSVIANIKVPEAGPESVEVSVNLKMVWIGIDHKGDDQPPSYWFKVDLEDIKETNRDLNEEQVLKKVEEILAKRAPIPEVRIAAHRQLSFDLIRSLAIALEKYKSAGKITVIKVEVGEKK